MSDAYLAGFFDGEGSISITCNNVNALVPFISIGQIDRRPLELFVTRFGGFIYDGRPKGRCSAYRLTGTRTKVLLEALLPYLIVKQRQAKLCLRFIDLMGRAETRPEREQMRIWMRALNAREDVLEGPSDT